MSEIFNMTFLYITLCAFLNIYVYTIVYQKISNIKHKLLFKDYIHTLIASMLVTFNNLNNSSVTLASVISSIIILILLKSIFREKWYKTCCIDSIIALVAFILDPVLSIVMSFVYKNIFELNLHFLPKLIITIIFSYLYYSIFSIKKLLLVVKSIINVMYTKKKLLLFIYTMIIVIAIFNGLYCTNYLDYKYYITILLMIFFMMYFSILFYKEIYNNKLLSIKNKYLNGYLENYEKMSDNYRTLKHNLRNDLYLIKCSKEKDAVINKMYEKYTDDETWVNKICGIPSGLQGIIFLKMQYAETKNIKFMVDNKLKDNELDETTQTYLDTCEIVAICLDNAIEACEETDKKLISMDINHQESYYIIEITNTFKNKLDIDRLGEKNYSTKNRNSGIGLNYIENLNKSITVKRLIIENIFRTIIKVEKNRQA